MTIVKPGPNERIYPATKLAAIVEALGTEGIPATEALRGIPISRDALFTPGTRVSFHHMIDACRNASRLSHDPHFAFHTGLRLHITTYGMFGFAILSSVTFRQAIRFALQYQELATPLFRVAVREEHGRVKWIFRPIQHPHIDAPLYRFLVEFELAAVLCLHRDVMGAAFSAREIQVTFSSPRDARIYRQMFGSAVLFGRSENQLVFDGKWLDEVPQLGNAITHSEVVRLCDILMDQMRLRLGLSGRVREVLLHNVMKGMSLNAVAAQLHVTVRTLRRRLRAENTSFRELVADLKLRLAIKYLGETDLTIADVADSLGFNDEASFRHAFRRWTKTTPGKYRARLRRSIAACAPATLAPVKPAETEVWSKSRGVSARVAHSGRN
jgi:AraC-like DNA-binding protein